MAVFPWEPVSASFRQVLFNLFRKTTSVDNWNGDLYGLDVLRATQPSVSEHWREHKALSLSGLASFFHDPQPDSGNMGIASFTPLSGAIIRKYYNSIIAYHMPVWTGCIIGTSVDGRWHPQMSDFQLKQFLPDFYQARSKCLLAKYHKPAGLPVHTHTHTHTHNRFTALFSGTTRVSRCQKRTSGLYGARGD